MDISSKRPLAEVARRLFRSGNGIYIVGMDYHVGFVSVNGKEIDFIHSTCYFPHRHVVTEKYNTKNPLSVSNYRVVGKLFHDEMVIKWLLQKPYAVAR